MRSVSDTQISEFQFIRPDVGKKYYEVSSNGEIFVSVDCLPGQDTLARIETPAGAFLINRKGFFMPYASLKEEKSDAVLATSLLSLSAGSTLSLDGSSYSFSFLGLWKNQWCWKNDKNKAIIKYRLTIDGPLRGYVELSKDFSYLPNLELLMGVGIYFLVHLEEELSRLS